ncbi:MAG: hypothetical protein K2X67_14580 [Burkholderiales bacterium]|jgi:hypothetical protein|nr:hypothetical protein [Burkholderiales bacterium]
METQVVQQPRAPMRSRLARAIHSDRDYREAKALLARTMRSARSTEAALRAEALLREIVDYEIRVDAEDEDSLDAGSADIQEYGGPKRRWVDSAND